MYCMWEYNENAFIREVWRNFAKFRFRENTVVQGLAVSNEIIQTALANQRIMSKKVQSFA